MRFDIRTLKRTISGLAIAALMLVGSLSPALAQGKKNKKHKDRGNHYGWTRGRHVGWQHSRHRGRQWRDEDNRRSRRRAYSRHRRDERRDYRRYQRRNRVAYYGPPVREWQTQRRNANWRNRRY